MLSPEAIVAEAGEKAKMRAEDATLLGSSTAMHQPQGKGHRQGSTTKPPRLDRSHHAGSASPQGFRTQG